MNSGYAKKPFVLVLFGATGDLAKRKIFSALYYLTKSKRIINDFVVLGISRKNLSNQDFREIVDAALGYDAGETFLNKFYFISMDASKKEDYSLLSDKLNSLKSDYEDNFIFYLSTPPTLFKPILTNLLESGLLKETGDTRIAFEKPFGSSFKDSEELNNLIEGKNLKYDVYRIDHYLNYKTVRNLLAFRFSNIFFEKLWNKDFIDHVQIIATEKIGIEGRKEYFDKVGLIKDMFQNHLLQLLALIGMEEPESLRRDDIAKVKRAFFNSIEIGEDCELIKGQYEGYEDEVRGKSNTETFLGLKLFIDNPRWKGVPFYFKSGKFLDKKETKIYVRFKKFPPKLFKGNGSYNPNSILINVTGEEGISLRFNVYENMNDEELEQVHMTFLEDKKLRQNYLYPYERLLYRVIRKQSDAFLSGRESEMCWRIVEELTDKFKTQSLIRYEKGSKGPKKSFDLMRKDGRKWLK